MTQYRDQGGEDQLSAHPHGRREDVQKESDHAEVDAEHARNRGSTFGGT